MNRIQQNFKNKRAFISLKYLGVLFREYGEEEKCNRCVNKLVWIDARTFRILYFFFLYVSFYFVQHKYAPNPLTSNK